MAAEVLPGFIRLRLTNPPATGENPDTTANRIARKEVGQDDSELLIIGTCSRNGMFEDWIMASKVSYVYKARSIA